MAEDRKLFTLDSLGDLDDGATRLLVDAAIAEALEDCDNRPSLDKPRRVVVTLEFTPVLSQFGGMKGVDAEAKVKTTFPARAARSEYLPTNARGDTVEAFLPTEHPTPLFTAEEKN